jgi:hypothetical protein
MRGAVFAALAALGLLTAGAAAAEPVLTIRDAAVHVTVVAEPRSDVQVTVTRTNPSLPVDIRREGERVIIQGHLPPIGSGCYRNGGAPSGARIDMIRLIPEAALTQVIVHAPLDLVLQSTRGAVFAQIGPSRSLRLGVSGCGSWSVGDVAGRLAVIDSGSADIHAGNAGRAELTLQGSGDAWLNHVAGSLDGRIPGSGDLTVASAGPTTFSVQGSGDIRGGVFDRGVSTVIAGSGDFTADRADGPVSVRIMGSGDVRLHDGHATTLIASILGSGDVAYGGTAGGLDATILGAGDIRVRQVTGPVRQTIHGSGDVHVGS